MDKCVENGVVISTGDIWETWGECWSTGNVGLGTGFAVDIVLLVAWVDENEAPAKACRVRLGVQLDPE